ncbi:hypothetical protein PInf_021083 [Phytophthora infestans]|nr:hypothetical protein PInf_021083 [Phytophthora infestans]
MMMVTPTHVGDAVRKKFAAERTDSKKGLLDRSNAMMKPYARACVEAAKEAGVSVLDLYSHFDAMTVTARDKLLVDGVHFNAAGHLVVDEKLRATILKEFPEVNDLLDTYQFPIVSRWMKDDPYVPEDNESFPTRGNTGASFALIGIDLTDRIKPDSAAIKFDD